MIRGDSSWDPKTHTSRSPVNARTPERPNPRTHFQESKRIRVLVLTPDFVKLGVLRSALRRPHRDIVSARVGERLKTILIEFFGPQA